jgi:autotransporter translocation and assembly factor TamB
MHSMRSPFFIKAWIWTVIFCTTAHQITANPFFNILNQSIPDLVLKTIHRNINGTLEAERITFSPPSTLIFDHLSLKDQHKQTIIATKKVTLNLSLLSLFIGKIKVSSISAENPDIHLAMKKGELNLSHMFAKIKEKKTDRALPLIDLNHIQITNGRLSWIDEKNHKLFFDQIFSSGQIQLSPQGAEIQVVSLKSRQGNLSFEQNNWNVKTLFVENAYYQKQVLEIKNLTAKIVDTPLQAQGSIHFRGHQFLIRSQLSSLKIFDLPIKKALLDLEIDSRLVLLKKSMLELNDNSLISSHGLFDFGTRALKIDSHIHRLPLKNVQKLLHFDLAANALFSGQLNVSGIMSEDSPVQIQASATVDSLVTHDFYVPSSNLDLSLIFTPQRKIKFVRATLNNNNLNLSLDGYYDLNKKIAALSFDLDIQTPHIFYTKTPKDLLLKGFHAKGSFNGAPQEASFSAKLLLNALQKDKTHGKNLSATLRINQHAVIFENIEGTLAKGQMKGNLCFDRRSQKSIRGTITIRNAIFEQISLPAFLPSKISGNLDAQVDILGTWQQPVLQTRAQLANAHLQTLFFPKITTTINYVDSQIQIKNFEAHMPYGDISAPIVTINLAKKSLQGLLIVHQLSLEGFPSLSKYGLTGITSGYLQISHHLEQPKIHGYLSLQDVTWKKQPIGNGNTFVWYHPSQNPFLQLSGDLNKDDASIVYRTAIDLARKKIRTELALNDVSILPWTSLPASVTMPLQGKIFGTVQMDGSFNLPNIKAKITCPNIQYQENIPTNHQTLRLEKQWVSAGPLILDANIKEGQLAATLSGFPREFPLKNDPKENRLHVSINGFFREVHDYDLQIDGRIDVTKLERWIRFIKNELSSVDANFTIHTRLTQKSKQDKIIFKGHADVIKLAIDMPGLAPIALKEKSQIQFQNNSFKFMSPALFSLASGELSVSGFASNSQLKLKLDGRIPLIFTKYFSPFFITAAGLSTGSLALSGTLKKPLLDGHIIPDKGSFLKPSTILDDIIFNSGQINFKSSQREKNLSLWFDQIDVMVGDGHAHLNGTVVLHTQYQPKQSSLVFWDLHLKGDEIVLRNQRDWMEMNLDVSFRSQNKKDMLSGKINISDGHLFKKFAFQNFILSSEQISPLSLPKWLWPVQVDVKIAASSFHTQAQMSAFFIDSQLTANLNLIGTLASPKLIGSVDVSEGIFKFPLLYFEIPSTSILFKNTPGRFIDPQIRIFAYADLPRKRFNLSEDTILELSLAGNFEKMKFDIKTLSGDKTFDRNRLLLLLLGSSNGGTEMLEDMLSSYTGTRILIGSALQAEGIATQVQWQLNPRLELEGTARTTASDVNFQDLKFKLMLFDHLPFGKKLFLESVLLSPATEASDVNTREDIRLKFRVLEQ